MIEVKEDGVYQDGIKIAEDLDNAGWNQGYLQMAGLYQKQYDMRTCQKCGYCYEVRRTLRLYPGSIVADYREAPDPGCPKGCK